MPPLALHHLSLARSYIRELRRFPDQVTRSYLLNLLHKRCRRPHGQDPQRVQTRVLKTVNFIETVRLKIAAANSGHVSVFEHLLKEAFARTGERREAFLKPFLDTAPQQVPADLKYPESKFPIYPPLLTSLLTSPISNTIRTRPALEDLQSIPPTSLITNTWSDLPAELQPDLTALGKAKHMGVLHPARQINHRKRLRRRWIDSLIGPPLGPILPLDASVESPESPEAASVRIKADFGTSLPPSIIAESEVMLHELRRQAATTGPCGTPRHAARTNESTISPLPRHRRATQRVPSKLPASHPLSPSPILNTNPDPLRKLLPKRQQQLAPPLSFSLKHGPRTLRARLVRRRYQRLLTMVPVLTTTDQRQSASPAKGKRAPKPTLDRSWITPQARQRVVIERAGPELGTVGLSEMDGEDLLWLNSE